MSARNDAKTRKQQPTSRPRLVRRWAVCCALSLLRSARTMSAPASAKAPAIAAPMPRPAPVTTATLPVRSIRLGVRTASSCSGHDKGICRESDGGHRDSPLFSVGNHPDRACCFDGPKGKLLNLARGAVFLEDLETIFPVGEIFARVKSPELN